MGCGLDRVQIESRALVVAVDDAREGERENGRGV